MVTQSRRYVFLDYEILQQIKFKKLEKVCDKVFVFTGYEVDAIPYSLVKDMQKMGSNVKWIEVGSASVHDINYHICFLMGKLHEKISPDVEFAVLSNDISFDPLVQFINSTGRSCVRVREQSMYNAASSDSEPTDEPQPNAKSENTENPLDFSLRLYGERRSESTATRAENMSDPVLIEETAKETVRRLIRSGNRPTSLNLLRNYILLHNQELSIHGNVEKIIHKLLESNQIRVNQEQVLYNF